MTLFLRCLCLCVCVFVYQAHSQPNNGNTNTKQSQANQNIAIPQPLKVALEPDQQEIESEKGYKKRQEERDQSNAFWNKWGIGINSALFVLVLIGAYISHRQLRSMEAGLKQTKDLFDAAQRPSIGIENGEVTFAVGEVPKVVLIARNFGKSPAKVISTKGYSNLYNVATGWKDTCPPPVTERPGEGMISSPVLPPSAILRLPYAMDEPVEDGAEFLRYESGLDAVFVWCRIQYKGLESDKIFTTEYYARYYVGLGFAVCDHHNEAT